jgi:hypothetical protein
MRFSDDAPLLLFDGETIWHIIDAKNRQRAGFSATAVVNGMAI